MSGWIGSPEELDHVLHTACDDRDDEGRFLLYEEAVIRGLDGDIVVPSATEISVAGERCNLATLLGGTSYGVPITVL
ncbi:hypothetical protein [Botrimarina mediterranea]|uniref:hypothetical protein n=1 Tax=Botrimarina mediterranea TaxID=2528022 RepID=UPI00118D25E4|nr:hypothetical protein K2D_46690 [Planctomycetes bacterium K2D]